MNRVVLQSLLAVAVIAVVNGSTSTAQAQWVYGGPVTYGAAYAPVATYSPVVVAQPYVAYSTPYLYGSYGYAGYSDAGYPYFTGYASGAYPYAGYYGAYPVGYGFTPRVVRERYNYGLFGNYNYHFHARGNGYGPVHYHARSPGYWGYGYYW